MVADLTKTLSKDTAKIKHYDFAEMKATLRAIVKKLNIEDTEIEAEK